MASLAEALKSSIPAEEPSEDPIAPAEAPNIEAEFEAEPSVDDETGDKPVAGEAPTPDKPRTPEQVPWKALKDEREKRQKLEADLAYLRGKLDAKPQEQQHEPDDEELDNEFLLSPSATLNARVEKRVTQEIRDYRANLSDAVMRREAEDYPELLQEFSSLAQANPELWVRASEELEPARAIYNFVKARRAGPAKPVDEKKLREEIRAELEQEYKKKEALEEAEETPPSPAGSPGSGESPTEKFKTVDDLFAKRRRTIGL